MRRFRWMMAGAVLLGAAACDAAEAGDIEPLPALERPTPEQRAGLPVIGGRWLFTGFEYDVRDTARVREQVYRLVPPGEFRVATQRLDSVAGQYVRSGAAFPFTGEVRRDGLFTFVAFTPEGAGSFVAGRFARDTLWIELTGFGSAAGWPPGTRAALVRRPRGAPFTRLRNFVPPPDTTAADSAAPAVAPPASTGGEAPSAAPPVVRPPAGPPPAAVPAQEPPPVRPQPPTDTPRPAPPVRRPPRPEPRETLRFEPPPSEPEPDPDPDPPVIAPPPPPPPPSPLPTAPRETIRFGRPPRQ